MIYWVVVSKQHKKLWTPFHDEDFHDAIYWTKEDAENTCDERYMAVRVEMKIIEELNMKHLIFILFSIFWTISIITTIFNLQELNVICLLSSITLIVVEVIDRRKSLTGFAKGECYRKLYGKETQ